MVNSLLPEPLPIWLPYELLRSAELIMVALPALDPRPLGSGEILSLSRAPGADALFLWHGKLLGLERLPTDAWLAAAGEPGLLMVEFTSLGPQREHRGRWSP